MPAERVQKILAQVGIASRRKAEELITEGVITINGRVAQLGDKAELGKDAIKVRGKLIQGAEPPIYIAFYKPKGVISALTDPEGRPTMAGFLTKIRTRVFPVGRMDFNSEGLLLLTNDGAIAEQLQKRDNIVRVYQIKVKGHPDPTMIARLERGARMGNKLIKPYSVRIAQDLQSKAKIEIALTGITGVDLKAFFEMKGFLVEKMVRTAIGQITLRGMQPGGYRFLKASQVQALLNQPELGTRIVDKENEKALERAKRKAAHEEAYAKRHPAKPSIKPVAKRGKVVIRPVKPSSH